MAMSWEVALNRFERVIDSGNESMQVKAIMKLSELANSAPEDILISTIPTLARVLDNYEVSGNSGCSIQKAAAYCLKKMASLGNGRIATKIGESSVILSILRLLPESENTFQTILVKCLLSIVTFGSENREIVAGHGGVEIILNKLNSSNEDNSVRKYLLEILTALTSLVEVRRHLGWFNGLGFLIEAVKVGSMVSRARACRAIGLLGIARRARRSLVELGAIPVLVELLRDGDDEIRLVVANTLGVISAQVDYITIVKECGAIPLYAGLIQGPSSIGRDTAKDVFCILAVSEENAVEITGHLVGFLREGDDVVKAASADVLWDIASYKHSVPVIRNSGAIPVLVDLLNNGSDQVREKVSGAIAQLSYDEGDRVALVEAGAVSLMIQLLSDELEEVRDNTEEALVNFAEDPLQCERITDVVGESSFQSMEERITMIRNSDDEMTRSFRRMNIQQLMWDPILV